MGNNELGTPHRLPGPLPVLVHVVHGQLGEMDPRHHSLALYPDSSSNIYYLTSLPALQCPQFICLNAKTMIQSIGIENRSDQSMRKF